jgi:hypothetical protein
MLIAVRTKLSLKQTGIALKSLDSLGIAATKDGRVWHLTRRGIGALATLRDAPTSRRRRFGRIGFTTS